jgi:tetratricopeptide (TPR) repeat protein
MTKIDEQTFRIRLIKLLKKKTGSKVLPLLKRREINEIWCDKAVAVYMACGEKAKALEIIGWAKDNSRDIASYRRCLLEYASSLLTKYAKIPEEKAIYFGQATIENREIFQEVISILTPIVDHIKANEKVSNPLELKALLQTLIAAVALGDASKLNTLGPLLRKYEKIPLEYVKLVLGGLIPAVDPINIVERIRSEYKRSFEANILALAVESELCGKAKEAIEKGKQLKSIVSSSSEKRELCGLLFQISQQIDIVAMEDANKIAEELLGEKDKLTNVIAAAIQLRQGKIQPAKDILEKNKNEDDPQWLQVYSYCLFSENNFKDGLTYFTKAIEKIPTYDMYKVLGEAAFRGGFIDKAILAFETILNATPSDEYTRVKVAQLYLKANDYQGAEPHLKKLWEIDKDNIPYGMNYAACVANQGRVDDAIGIYKSLCNRDKPPVEAVVAVAQLYQTKHQPQEGFKFLNNYKDTFWDNPGFLMIYMNLGYAANQEMAAHEAFVKALELQATGKAPPEIIQTKTLDDLLQHHKQWTERTEMICKNILQGKFPWLTADNLLNHASFMGWAIRTQPLTWLGDDVVSRASYAIYSTNGSHPKEVNGKRSLNPLTIPSKGSEVVIDLSSLITLYHMDLLEETHAYFSKIYISTRYAPHLIADVSRLEFHQLSHIKSAKLIKHEIDSGSISVLDEADTPDNKSYPYVHEYTDDIKEHYYRLIDVCKVLSDNGKITKAKNDELLRIASKPSGVDDKHPPLQYSQQIIVELSTLRTLINFNIYDALKDSFRVSINHKSKVSLDADLRTIEYQERIQRCNDDLINKISDTSFEKLAPAYENKEDELDISIDSYHLAKSKNLNLFIDERVIQAFSLNDDKFKGEVFGIDCLLKAFEQEKFLDESLITEAFLKLMRWRYCFLVPSLDMLLYLAKEYAANPPGQKLRDIAHYVHDCMRDPGLFSGLEKTDPPQPMCGHLFIAWFDIVFEFIVRLWADAEMTSEVACTYTGWALRELMPSPPKAFIHQGERGAYIVNITTRLSLEKTLGDFAINVDTSRAKTAISEIRKAFYMSDTEFYRMFTETLDLIVTKHGEEKD